MAKEVAVIGVMLSTSRAAGSSPGGLPTIALLANAEIQGYPRFNRPFI